jgi:hypothetical protein
MYMYSIDEKTKEIVALIPSYDLENWEERKAAKKLEIDATSTNCS